MGAGGPPIFTVLLHPYPVTPMYLEAIQIADQCKALYETAPQAPHLTLVLTGMTHAPQCGWWGRFRTAGGRFYAPG